MLDYLAKANDFTVAELPSAQEKESLVQHRGMGGQVPCVILNTKNYSFLKLVVKADILVTIAEGSLAPEKENIVFLTTQILFGYQIQDLSVNRKILFVFTKVTKGGHPLGTCPQQRFLRYIKDLRFIKLLLNSVLFFFFSILAFKTALIKFFLPRTSFLIRKTFFLYICVLILNSDSDRWQLLRILGKDKISQESVMLLMTCLCKQPERGKNF